MDVARVHYRQEERRLVNGCVHELEVSDGKGSARRKPSCARQSCMAKPARGGRWEQDYDQQAPSGRRRSGNRGRIHLLSRFRLSSPHTELTQELFKKTIGPLKDSFIVYNSQGRSKGIAIVSFVRAGDAAVARQKYHGKHLRSSFSHVVAHQNTQVKLLTDVCAFSTGQNTCAHHFHQAVQ